MATQDSAIDVISDANLERQLSSNNVEGMQLPVTLTVDRLEDEDQDKDIFQNFDKEGAVERYFLNMCSKHSMGRATMIDTWDMLLKLAKPISLLQDAGHARPSAISHQC